MDEIQDEVIVIEAEDIDFENSSPYTTEKECTLCERLAGLAGVLLGVALAAIALDLATGGKISSMVNGFRPAEVEDR